MCASYLWPVTRFGKSKVIKLRDLSINMDCIGFVNTVVPKRNVIVIVKKKPDKKLDICTNFVKHLWNTPTAIWKFIEYFVYLKVKTCCHFWLKLSKGICRRQDRLFGYIIKSLWPSIQTFLPIQANVLKQPLFWDSFAEFGQYLLVNLPDDSGANWQKYILILLATNLGVGA